MFRLIEFGTKFVYWVVINFLFTQLKFRDYD